MYGRHSGHHNSTSITCAMMISLHLLILFIILCTLLASVDELFLQGNEHYRNGDVTKAIEFFQAAIKEDPSRSYVWTNLGHCLLAIDDVESAIQAFYTSYSLTKTAKSAYNLAVAYQMAMQDKEAISYYKGALQLDNGYSDARYNLGVLYQDQGNLVDAIVLYEHIFQLEHNNSNTDKPNKVVLYHKEAHINYCNILLVQYEEPSSVIGKGEVEACYLTILTHAPDYVRCLVNLGSYYWQHINKNNIDNNGNDYEKKAIDYFQQAISLDPYNKMALHALYSLTKLTSKAQIAVQQMDPEYVKELFDSYSFHFESSLVNRLAYQAHTLTSQAAVQYSSTWLIKKLMLHSSMVHILDLGAGTGLTCPLLRQEIVQLVQRQQQAQQAEQQAACQQEVCLQDSLDISDNSSNISSDIEIISTRINITAVDISRKMLLKAYQEKPNCYQELIVEDIVTFLTEITPQGKQGKQVDRISKDDIFRYDIFLAADVFMYFGDLTTIFALVKQIMHDNNNDSQNDSQKDSQSVFVFTVEDLIGNMQQEANQAGLEIGATTNVDYQLQRSGRFGHTATYLQRLAKEYGYEILTLEPIIPRYDKDIPIQGWLMALKVR